MNYIPKRNTHRPVGWYRATNPAGLDLVDVTSDSTNALLGIVSLLVNPPVEISYRICTVEIILIGVHINVEVFQSKKDNSSLYLSIPEGVDLSYKVQAQVLRYIERLVDETMRRSDGNGRNER